MILLLLPWRQVGLIIFYCEIYMIMLQSGPVKGPGCNPRILTGDIVVIAMETG